MKNLNFEKLEKKLKTIDLPDFELPQRKNILRQALLDSPYFEKKENLLTIFKTAFLPLGAVSLILFFVFFGYPYSQYFYGKAQAESILDKTQIALGEVSPEKKFYAFFTSPDSQVLTKNLSFGRLQEIPSETLDDLSKSVDRTFQFQPEVLPDNPDRQFFEENLRKIEFDVNQLKEAKTKGEIKFLQYVGEEKMGDTVFYKIRYTNREGNLITEIRINSQTNLPEEINIWQPEKEIKRPPMLRETKIPLTSEPGRESEEAKQATTEEAQQTTTATSGGEIYEKIIPEHQTPPGYLEEETIPIKTKIIIVPLEETQVK